MPSTDSDSDSSSAPEGEDEEHGAPFLCQQRALSRGRDARDPVCRGLDRLSILLVVGVALCVAFLCEVAVWQFQWSPPSGGGGHQPTTLVPRKGHGVAQLDEVRAAREQALSQQSPKASAAVQHVKELAAAPQAAAAAPAEISGGAEVGDASTRLVDELYTFGAPGTCSGVLYDATREDGCIPGLRIFNRAHRYTLGSGIEYTIDDPMSWITAAFGLKHARMEAMPSLQDDIGENPIHACGATAEDPRRDDFWWFGGHMIYEGILQKHADANRSGVVGQGSPHGPVAQGVPDRLRRAYEMSHFAFIIYNVRTQLLGVDAPDWGWTFVSRSCSLQKHNGVLSPACNDHVALYQHDTTLECAVVFEGTRGDDVLDWLADLDVSLEPFCDFGLVHRGFKHKLWRMARGLDYQQTVRSKLHKCNGVVVAGHSLGGTQAELFTACANRGLKEGDEGFDDFKLLAFEKGTPERMPPFFSDQAEGAFFKNKGTGKCLDVAGTMGTDYDTEVNLYDCETPTSHYGEDQRFDHDGQGFLQNHLSGMCVGLDGDDVVQRKCNRTSGSDQRWEATPEGFLKNVQDGRCVDSKMKMYTCPYTDQKWEFRLGGLLVNRLSGLCLMVTEEEGAVLRPCQGHGPQGHADYWELTPSGLLRNRLTTECLKVQHERGSVEVKTDTLVLAECGPKESRKEFLWSATEDGFLRSLDSGTCLDVEGTPGAADLTPVGLGPCEDQHIVTGALWKLMEGGLIRNRGYDWLVQYYCLEVMGAYGTDEKLQDGARLHMDICKLNTDQKWELTGDGLLRSVIGGRKCVDVRDALPGSLQPSRLWLKNCMEWEDPIQFLDWKWDLLPDGRIKNRQAMKCMDVAGEGQTMDGSSVDLWACDDADADSEGKSDLRWHIRDDGYIVNEASGKCLDVSGAAADSDGSLLVLWPCDSQQGAQTDKKWELTPTGFLLNRLSAKCVAVSPGINSQGVLAERLVLQTCPTIRQKWELTAEGQIRNRYTSECLDTATNITNLNGWDLVVQPCDAESANQKWERLPAA